MNIKLGGVVLLLIIVGCAIQQEKTEYPEVPEPEEDILYVIEPFVGNLEVPWSIVFTSQDRMLVTERKGAVRVIENGVLRDEVLISFPEVSSRAEEGLMGLTLHPEYSVNKLFYVSLAYIKDTNMVVKVVQLKDNDNSATIEKIIIDDIPAARFHAGSRIKFGPDKKLYITTGDAIKRELAQDLDSLAGKLLRLNEDGSIPNDNPFGDSPIYSYGHRNSQGIDWHPSGTLWSTEHGPSTFDGPPGGDEVNLIKAGKNYGWPLVSHTNNEEGLEAPKIVFTPAEPPASGMFYTATVLPQFTGNFFFGSLKGEGIIRVIVSDDGRDVISFEKMDLELGRIRDVAQGPGGFIYFSTSNRDGRGKPKEGDDTIYRIRPE